MSIVGDAPFADAMYTEPGRQVEEILYSMEDALWLREHTSSDVSWQNINMRMWEIIRKDSPLFPTRCTSECVKDIMTFSLPQRRCPVLQRTYSITSAVAKDQYLKLEAHTKDFKKDFRPLVTKTFRDDFRVLPTSITILRDTIKFRKTTTESEMFAWLRDIR